MHYHIYCKEKSIASCHRTAIAEFEKRLSAYCDTTLHVSSTLIFSKEFTKNNHHFLFICSGPSTYSSEEFAVYLQKLQQSGNSTVHIVIGYTEEEFYNALYTICINQQPDCFSLTNSQLSIQTLTLLFFEQLYRAYTILQGKIYHK